MIKEIEAKDLILRAGELEKKYPGLNRIVWIKAKVSKFSSI